jgi:hypothetical protein
MAAREPTPRPRAKTPAERGEEAAAVQRRLKQEAAARRELAAAAGPPAKTRGRGSGSNKSG